jgi:hypothetical protein
MINKFNNHSKTPSTVTHTRDNMSPFSGFKNQAIRHQEAFNYFLLAVCLAYSFILKVKLSLYRPWRPLGLREVEAATFAGIRLTDGGKVVSPTRWPLFTPMKIPVTHFC